MLLNSSITYQIRFGKNAHIRRISNSVTHLRSFETTTDLQNPYSDTAVFCAIERGE